MLLIEATFFPFNFFVAYYIHSNKRQKCLPLSCWQHQVLSARPRPLVTTKVFVITPKLSGQPWPFAGESPPTLGPLHLQAGQVTAMTLLAAVSCEDSDLIHTLLPLKRFGLGFIVLMSSACVFQEIDALSTVFVLSALDLQRHRRSAISSAVNWTDECFNYSTFQVFLTL